MAHQVIGIAGPPRRLLKAAEQRQEGMAVGSVQRLELLKTLPDTPERIQAVGKGSAPWGKGGLIPLESI